MIPKTPKVQETKLTPPQREGKGPVHRPTPNAPYGLTEPTNQPSARWGVRRKCTAQGEGQHHKVVPTPPLGKSLAVPHKLCRPKQGFQNHGTEGSEGDKTGTKPWATLVSSLFQWSSFTSLGKSATPPRKKQAYTSLIEPNESPSNSCTHCYFPQLRHSFQLLISSD